MGSFCCFFNWSYKCRNLSYKCQEKITVTRVIKEVVLKEVIIDLYYSSISKYHSLGTDSIQLKWNMFLILKLTIDHVKVFAF